MPLENLTGSNVFITNLVPSNPAGTDPVSEGDDHIKGTKNVLLNSFPNINGRVTATPVQLNQLAPAAGAEFTGIPTAPTAEPGTDTTQIATTAFVVATLADASLGIGQTWQNMTGSRVSGETYINNTGKPISISVYATTAATGSGALNGSVNGVSLFASAVYGTGIGYCPTITFIVPNGGSYSVTYTGSGGGSITVWAELR